MGENGARNPVEGQLDRFFELSLEMLCIAGVDGYFKRVNPAFTQTLGWNNEELLARPFLDFVHPDERGATLHEVKRQVAGGAKVMHFENRYQHKDGSYRLLSWMSVPGDDGYMFATARDITAQKQSDKLMRENTVRLQAILDTVVDGIISIDEIGIIETINPAAERIFGYTAAEVIGQNITLLMPEPYHSRHDGYLEHFRATGESRIIGHNLEVVGQRKDGSVFPMEIAVNTLQLGDKRRFIGILRDITERKQVKTQMEMNNKELADFKAALDEHAIVATTDAHGAITYVNDKFCAISKYARDELIGQNHRIINSGYHTREFFDELWQVIRSGRVWKGEIRNRAKDGTFYWVDTTIVPILDEPGKPCQYIAIRADITARKVAEQKLVVARDDAEFANRAKDSFLATMSHEIRTPLAGMLGMLEVLSLSPLDSEQKAMLKVVWDSSRSLLRIVNDILDWSKIEDGKMRLEPRATSIPQLLQEVANTYSRVASAKSLVLRHAADPGLGQAHLVDSLRLSQILNNFVSNAIKFTRHGEVELRAELLKQLDDEQRIRLSVRDTGIGIDEETQLRLFQRYQQGGADTARLYGGTGLGLAICEQLAKLMGGQIEVASVHGMGTTFSLILTLPVSSEPAVATPRRLHADVEQKAVKPLFDISAKTPLVLVVDDHPTNRDLLTRQLKLLGLRAETAADGEAALSLWRAGRYAMVITDCHMPNMDGFALSQAIRRIEAEDALARTPVIAWTANALSEEEVLCYDAGMDELLVKPVDMKQLKGLLARWLPVAEISLQSEVKREQVAGPIDYAELKKVVPESTEQISVLYDFQLHLLIDRTRLIEMLALGDRVNVERTAHRMKGSSRMVGARELATACTAIEQAAREGDLNGAKLAILGLDEALARLENHLAATGVT